MILRDESNKTAVLVGRPYRVKYYGAEEGKRSRAFCCFNLSYTYRKDSFGDNRSCYMQCIAFEEFAEYIRAMTDGPAPTLLVVGTLNEREYNGKKREEVVIEYVSVQPTIPTTVKRKREKESFPDIDF